MFKPLTRSSKNSHRSNGGFAETMFVHGAEEDDYSGFAPTEMFEEQEVVTLPVPAASAEVARAAASTSRTVLERAATSAAPVMAPEADVDAVEEPAIPQSWVTSQWVAAQEAKAHEAADHARAVIAAQRRADEQAEAAADEEAAPAAPRGLARLRAAFERLLPGDFRSLLPLFIGVTVTVAVISAVLPLIDKP